MSITYKPPCRKYNAGLEVPYMNVHTSLNYQGINFYVAKAETAGGFGVPTDVSLFIITQSGATTSRVFFDNVPFSLGGFDIQRGIYIAPVTGYYQFNVYVRGLSNSASPETIFPQKIFNVSERFPWTIGGSSSAGILPFNEWIVPGDNDGRPTGHFTCTVYLEALTQGFTVTCPYTANQWVLATMSGHYIGGK